MSLIQTERLEDRPSGDKVRSCFRSLAGEKVRSTRTIARTDSLGHIG